MAQNTLQLKNITADIKPSLAGGVMRWKAQVSSTAVDLHGEQLDLSLLQEIKANYDAEYRPDDSSLVGLLIDFSEWDGPYLDAAHASTVSPKFRVGSVKRLYLDGEYLKASGEFDPTDIGRAAYANAVTNPGKLKTSIGFVYDPTLAQTVEIGGKAVRRLVGGSGVAFAHHFALTGSPANLDANFNAKSDGKKFNLEDFEDDLRDVLGNDALVDSLLAVKSKIGENMSDEAPRTAGVQEVPPTPVEQPCAPDEANPVPAPAGVPTAPPQTVPDAPAAPAPVVAPAAATGPVAGAKAETMEDVAQMFAKRNAQLAPASAPVTPVVPAAPVVAAAPTPAVQTASAAPAHTLTEDELNTLVSQAVASTLEVLAPLVKSEGRKSIPPSAIVTMKAASQPELTMTDIVQALRVGRSR